MEKSFVDNEDGDSEEQRSPVGVIDGGMHLIQMAALARSTSSGFVKRLNKVDLRGAPKRDRR